MTRNEAAKRYAKDKGITIQQATNHIKSQSKPWVEWLAKHPECEINKRGSTAMMANAKAGSGVEEMLEMDWKTIKSIQRAIDDIISSGENIGRIKLLSDAKKTTQLSYIQLSEIKQRDEDRRGAVIKKQAVEAIVSDVLPKLKVALGELVTTIKINLPPEMRANFELAYQQSLPTYATLVNEAVDKLNDIIG